MKSRRQITHQSRASGFVHWREAATPKGEPHFEQGAHLPGLNFGALRQCQGIFDLHSEVPHRGLDLRVAEQYLNGAKVPVCL